ncbi:putative reverse transcriptase zinc-binding domain-containing protein [Helianthus annuus]|uniref:Reverse transcriptase zinc-binding domain-containing protein n=1 Tax=Helianthus annuus TaxID=4232 RepID=A0A9K3NGF6_HELAN|nr:putative reverse transcriptase zinc-binding domain-containing protein [Helianthus annuus]KAJ0905539.1 putative reverse transcriptase zinc-binding domain-containing protein [Helianthus annuus]KAJ0955087.1 putative reverse transcriptase zinc-binding domain-containing protein [Helianthus annuus]
MSLSKNWIPVIDSLKSRLNSWKALNLLFGGRLPLVKAVLGSLPVFFLSMFKAPIKIIGKWKGSGENKLCHVSDRIECVNDKIITPRWKWRRKKIMEVEKEEILELLDLLNLFHFGEETDKWTWRCDIIKGFSVQSARKCIEQTLHGQEEDICEWLSWVLIKINCFTWRLLQNSVPVAVNLCARGILSTSSYCVDWSDLLETVAHAFLECPFAMEVWRKVSVWARWDFTCFDNLEDMYHQIFVDASANSKNFLLCIMYMTIWTIWEERNDSVFRRLRKSANRAREDIISSLFNWICHRSKTEIKGWSEWVLYPLCIM